MVEKLGRWTCNPEARRTSPFLIVCWIALCSPALRSSVTFVNSQLVWTRPVGILSFTPAFLPSRPVKGVLSRGINMPVDVLAAVKASLNFPALLVGTCVSPFNFVILHCGAFEQPFRSIPFLNWVDTRANVVRLTGIFRNIRVIL